MFSGLFTAMITPFSGDQIDEEGFIHNIHFQMENKVDGIVVLGTTGEEPTLLENEKKELVALARKHYPGTLIIGTGTYSTQGTIENSLMAQDLGANALLIITPYYNKPPQEGIIAHFEAIANKVSLPIILYNNPVRTSINMELETIIKLAQIPNIAGIKECSCNLQQFTEIVHQVKSFRKDFCVLTGDDINIYSTMLLGGDGVISAVSNLIPDKILQLATYLKENEIAKAKELYAYLYPFYKAASLETNPIPIKEAMKLCELPAGSCRLPLSPIQEKNRIRLIAALEQLELKPMLCKV